MRKLPGGQAAAARLRRRGQIAVNEVARRRPARTQKIVAWRQDAGDLPAGAASARAVSARAGQERVRQILAEERGPLPLVQLLKIACVSRSLIERLTRQGNVQVWEEPAAEESLLEADFTPPSNMLNDEQQRAVNEIRGLARRRNIHRGPALRRDRQRQDGSVPARRRGDARARPDGADAGAGDRADALGRAAVPGAIWRRCRGAAQRTDGCGARARVVARAQWRSARRGGHALGRFRAARKCRPDHRRRRAGVQLQAGGNAALQRTGRGRGAREARRRGGAAGIGDALARKLSSRAARANTNCCGWTRASKIGRWRPWRSSTCARIFGKRTARDRFPSACAAS